MAENILEKAVESSAQLAVLVRNVFPPAQAVQLREKFFSDCRDFGSTEYKLDGTPSAALGTRRALVVCQTNIPELRARVMGLLPSVLEQLAIAPFKVGRVEVQRTAYLGGNFFKRHTDIGTYPDLRVLRMVSFVYYLHAEPKAFTGGELCIYKPDSDECVFKQMPPSNSLLFFPSQIQHEVLPIVSEETDLRMSRCTINGWICKRDFLLENANSVAKNFPKFTRPVRKLARKALIMLQRAR